MREHFRLLSVLGNRYTMSTFERMNDRADRPVLELIQNGEIAKVFEISGAELYIGKAPGSHIRLDDSLVSRKHARIERRPDGSCQLIDLDSRYHTFVDGERLEPFQPVGLQDGSRITIRDH